MEKMVQLNFFGIIVKIISTNQNIINRIKYIFRYNIAKENLKPEIIFKVQKLCEDDNVELISSQDKFNILYSYDTVNFKKWQYNDTFLPPMRIAPFAGKYLVLHGCAARKNSKTFAFIAPSMAGKTSLLIYLIYNGFKAISDDLLFIDIKSGKLIPYYKPVGVRETGLSIIPNLDNMLKKAISAETLIFKNFEGKRTWLVHLNDMFGEKIYVDAETKIDYFIIPNKEQIGKMQHMKLENAYNDLLNSLCNSGLNDEKIKEYCLNILGSSCFYSLPTNDISNAFCEIRSLL